MKRVFFNYLLVAALALSAVFTACEKTYTVTFCCEDGSFECHDAFMTMCTTKGSKTECSVNEPDPVREGYKFLGWFNGNNKWNIDDPIKSDLRVYARWEKIEVEHSVASELIGKWQAKSMVIKYLNFDYEDEIVDFDRTIEDGDMRPESMGFEFTSNTFRAFANGSINDEAEVYTEGNSIYVSSTIIEYNDFSWELSDDILTLTVTITDEWDGGSGSVEYIMTFVYTCEKRDNFPWEK